MNNILDIEKFLNILTIINLLYANNNSNNIPAVDKMSDLHIFSFSLWAYWFFSPVMNLCWLMTSDDFHFVFH